MTSFQTRNTKQRRLRRVAVNDLPRYRLPACIHNPRMDYKARRRYTAAADADDFKDNYVHDIQIYDVPPVGEMSLEEFQELGFDRLKGMRPIHLYLDAMVCITIYFLAALRLVETTNCRGDLKTLEDRKKALCDSLKSDGLKYYANILYADGSNPQSEEHSQTRKKDHVSHFILRLVYCHDPEQNKWFINQEVEFFKLRFSSLDKKGIEQLLNMSNIDCMLVSCIMIQNILNKIII